jgi:hypothetical protein
VVEAFSGSSAEDRYLPGMVVPLYLDPGSASILLQMIGGGVVAALVAVKMFWNRILVTLHLRPRDPAPTRPVEPPVDRPESR